MIAWTGMDPDTGRRVSGIEHIRVCVRKILTTWVGSCVERRDFGSELPNLVDAPLNAVTRQRAIAASADAIRRWEPRIRLTRITLTQLKSAPSSLTIGLYGYVVGGGNLALSETISLGSGR